MMRRVVLVLISLCGCPGDDAPADTDSGSSTGPDMSTSTSSTTTISTSSTTATTESSGTDSSETGPTEGCGDGVLDAGEQCDDGNQVDDDACSNECIPSCGLRWEYVLPPEGAIDLVAPTEDGNIRLAGIGSGRLTPALYHELVDDMGTSIETDTLDIGLTNVPSAPLMAAVGTGRGAYLFGDLNLGDGEAVRLASLDDDAMLAWDVEPEPALIDEPFDRGVALAPDGDAVVSGAVNVADGDDDIWVAKLSATDGSPVWTGTHTGPLVGGFSTDDGGPVAVAGDGSVYVLGLVREGLGLADGTLVKFADGGGAPEWATTIRVDVGNEDVFASAVAADAKGDVLAAVQVLVGATSTFEIHRLAPDGTTRWTFTTAQLELEKGVEIEPDDVVFPMLGFAEDGSATVAATVDLGVEGADLFVLRLSADGEQLCTAYHHVDEIEGDRAPTHLAVMPDGGAVVGGQGAGNDFSLEWVARFRP